MDLKEMNKTHPIYPTTIRQGFNFLHPRRTRLFKETRKIRMYDQIVNDLDLANVYTNISCKTSWGKKTFTNELQHFTHCQKTIQKHQLISMAFRIHKEETSNIRTLLENIDHVSEILTKDDERVNEFVQQILWNPTSVGSFLNTNYYALYGMTFWKTIFLPFFAILLPILSVIVPFIFLRMVKPNLSTSDYIERLRHVILQQISIPHVVKSRGSDDRVGFVLESLFIGFTLVMFISSIWNQINGAFHLRYIWNDIESRGKSIKDLVCRASDILDILHACPLKIRRALSPILQSGTTAYNQVKHFKQWKDANVFGSVWNDKHCLDPLIEWFGRLDVYTSIASLDNICFPTFMKKGLIVEDLHHPNITDCVRNAFQTAGHTILTGPNRGGKSTFCKSLGLAIVTAQSWGFAWAKSMKFAPFDCILTALEPYGKLGYYSTFEAEIDFAKHVLASTQKHQNVFIMMDEIFHSTNAHDGVEASKVFLGQLYETKNVVSVISTHYLELPTLYKDVATYCLVSSINPEDGSLIYTYKIASGISSVSSVMEILQERGLTTSNNA